MTTSSKSLTKLFVTVLIIAALICIAFLGVKVGNFSIPSAFDKDRGIRQGLDLTGGSLIIYEAEAETVSEADMSTVISMMRQRTDSLGYTEATIAKQSDKRVRIEIPSINNPEEAMQMLGKTAKLTFRDNEGNVLLEGTDVKDAQPAYKAITQGGATMNIIELTFTDEGRKKFAEATGAAAARAEGENYIAIYMDEDVVSSPRVEQKIESESAVIYGGFTAETASYTAGIIRAGQLPFALKDVELRAVGPTLGERALETSLFAGLIGIIAVMVFMTLFYRLPGFMAVISLGGYIALMLLVLTAFRVNLSLPGIAGIILSVGMAVDANVIIFERMKEELSIGKTIGAAIDAGFRRAFTAILDANITTLIAAVVLGYFGTGPIKGFAVTLGIGIVISMFTALFVTRFLLRQMVALNVRNKALYAGKGVTHA